MSKVTKGPHDYQVIVLGGGPAGAAAATFLQMAGHHCLIVERTRFPRYHVGESLIPHTFGTLDRLGLLPQMKVSHFPEKHSVRFVSVGGKDSDPFYFSETIEGEGSRTWQVERSEFDDICLKNARAAGVEVKEEVSVEEVLFDGAQAVGVRIRDVAGNEESIACSVVIDASGRASLVGRQLGLRGPVPGLRKASIWAYYRGGKRLEGIDAGETTILLIPNEGWFWYIPLPNDVVSVGIVADPDYLFDDEKDYERILAREIGKCAGLTERLSEARIVSPVRGLRELAYRNRDIAGPGWVMVGDAAAFLDPIYSSGLYLALGSAELAAGSVDAALKAGDLSAEALGTYTGPLGEGVGVIHKLIQAFYTPGFSFGEFAKRNPEHRPALIDCLVGDVIGKDMSAFTDALNAMMQKMADPGEAVANVS